MKSKALQRILAINKANPSTIKQWLKYRAEYDSLISQIPKEERSLLVGFTLGEPMPILGSFDNAIPKNITTTRHLFTAIPSRYYKVVDEKHISARRNGRFRTVQRAIHNVYIVSVAVFKGSTMEWLKGPSDVVRKYVLPDEYIWGKDHLGLKIIDKEGYDFHLGNSYKSILDNENFVSILIDAFQSEKKYKIRIEEKRLREKENEEFYNKSIQLLNEQLFTTRVTIQDSRNAGNCVEGTLAFAERVLKIPREEVISGSFLFSVPANRLYNSGDDRAKNACMVAFQRETCVSI